MRFACRAAAAAAVFWALAPAAQADFSFAVSPPRFELAARPGERLRHVIEITNTAPRASGLVVRTADWALQPDESVRFHDDLQPGSCRPWVAIERRELVVGAQQAYRFRFEVTPPADQPPVECRFAILLEGKEPTLAGAQRALPVAARVGVIVYAAVGDVKPELSITRAAVQMRNGVATPAIEVRNTGTAHGRLEGFLTARDARGQTFDAAPAGTPVLPGETRWVAIQLTRRGDAAAQPEFPLTVQGKLEWGKGRSTELQQRFER